jgi:hypothetical protein
MLRDGVFAAHNADLLRQEDGRGKNEEALPGRAPEEVPFSAFSPRGYFPSLPRGVPTPVH